MIYVCIKRSLDYTKEINRMRVIYLIGFMITFAFSDFTMVYKMDDNIHETIQYKDEQNVKLSYVSVGDNNNSNQEGQYLIAGRRYNVLNEDGNLTYTDLDKMEKEASKLENDLNITDENCAAIIKQPFFILKKKIGTQKVSGIVGESWDVTSKEDGEEYNETIVVSNNKDLLDAMRKSFKILKLFGEGPYGMEIGDDAESMMIIADNLVLLSAQGWEFVSLNHKKIPEDVIRLPKDAVEDTEEFSDIQDEETGAGKEVFKNILESDQVCLTQKE